MSLSKIYKTDKPRIIFYTSEELAQGLLNNKVFVATSALAEDTTFYKRKYSLISRIGLWQ